eukprot:TRINITY_DN54213_c0_g2_i1.p2 TRINITY_DN54213_c0_g2~~TRINITY_DN54213_c0_g2_i1.p2  ORF type:complete len:746 (+),score=59.69 TRINITY_DN54213_c0_g2_i1:30-2240(+)
MSEKSLPKYLKFRFLYKKIFENIDHVFAQSEEDSDRLKRLGAKKISVCGNLKLLNVPEVTHEYKIDRKNEIITAASTHESEEKIVLEAFKDIEDKKLIIVPRHPERFYEVEKIVREFGKKHSFSFSKLSEDDSFSSDITLVDKMGELVNIYAISDVVVLGGAFVSAGGHNPIEPASFGCKIISGVNIFYQLPLFEAIENYRLCDKDELQTLLINSDTLAPAYIKEEIDLDRIIKEIKLQNLPQILKSLSNYSFVLLAHPQGATKMLKIRFLPHIALLTTLTLLTGCLDSKDNSKSANEPQQMPPTPVKVYEAKSENVPLKIVYTGKTKSVGDISIHARVEGVLLEKNYTEGELVKKGDSLYQIDPSTYRANFQSAKAALEVEEAKFENAKKEWERVERLYEENAISQKERDSAEANFKAAQSSVKNAKAELTNANINLNNTKVIAPVEGIAGQKQQDVGNLVGPGANSLLTTITQLDPIYVEFAIPNDDVDMLNKKGASSRFVLPEDGVIKVHLEDSAGKSMLENGVVDFRAVTLDSETGSVNARAKFPNKDASIYPNQFGKVVIEDIALKEAIAIPQQAVMQSPQGVFAYVVDSGKATIRPIVLGATTDDNRWVVESGIKDGDKIIVNNLLKLKPNAPVQIAPDKESTKSAKPADRKEKQCSLSFLQRDQYFLLLYLLSYYQQGLLHLRSYLQSSTLKSHLLKLQSQLYTQEQMQLQLQKLLLLHLKSRQMVLMI